MYRQIVLLNIVCVVQLSCSMAFAENEIDDARVSNAVQKLTDGTKKPWTFERVVNRLGGEDECDQGEVWTFRSDYKIEIRRCVENEWHSQEDSWKINVENEIDLIVSIRGIEYTVIFPPPMKDEPEVEELILRIVADRPGQESKDYRFTYERD